VNKFMRKKRLPFWIFLFLLNIIAWQCAGTGSSRLILTENLTSTNLAIDSTISNDILVENLIIPYRQQLNQTMNKIIGYAEKELRKGRPEAPLNNFIAELMLKRANAEYSKKVHIAITNLGGIRASIPKGPITLGKIYEVMPFENELVVLEMTGEQVITLAKQIGERNGEAIAGMRLTFRNGQLITLTVQGEKVDPEEIYYVVTTDFLSNPGRSSLQVLGQAKRDFLGVLIRDAIIDEIRQAQSRGNPITAEVDGRIVFE